MIAAKTFAIAIADGVATFTLDRPAVRNALGIDTYEELRDAFRAVAGDDAVKAIVLTGSGGAFCSGGHVEEIIGRLVNMNEGDLRTFNRLTGDTVLAMRALAKPIVAAVDGIAAGGGAALALAADLRVGSPRARFAFLFSRVGLSAADMGVTWLLPRVVGLGRATELLFEGNPIDAETAHAWGLVNRIVPSESLLDEARATARRLATGATVALGVSKMMLEKSAAIGFHEALAMEAEAQLTCMKTDDFREGYRAFVEKRAPRWKGR